MRYTKDPEAEMGLKILEEDHYYPFGLKHHGYNNEHNIFYPPIGTPNKVVIVPITPELRDPYKFKYNGKELEEELGKDTYAYGWRDYDPAIGRFNKIDRFAEKYYDKTPFHYGANNPIYFIDVAGDSLYVTHRKGFLGLGGKETLRYEDGKLYNSNNSEYTGKVKGFLKKVTTALGAIAKGDEGSSMVSELQSSENSFTIQKGSKSEHKAIDMQKAYANQIQKDPKQSNLLTLLQNNGTDLSGGSGGNIFWNSSGSPLVTTSGTSTSAITDLAHEMFHSLDANRGLLDDRLQNGVKRSEWQATYRENTLRAQLGLPPRTHYKASLNQSTNVRTGIGPRMLSPAPINSPILPSWYSQ